MMFCMAKYSKDVLKMMYMMRSHHMLTDVILEVEKELFHVHKVVLSAASPYFKAMFTGGLKESEMSRVHLQGICPTAMGRMIYFMYTGNIRVTEVTVCQLLPAATMFQVPYVVDACCAFLERQLDPTNAIGISSFAEQHSCESLKQKANQFIERNFTQICQEEEFLQLSAIQLIGLIRKDELNVQGEREVYNAVLNWVKYDEDTRHPRMEHILYAVRCQLLPPSFLNDQVKNCELLRKAPNCRRYLEEIFKDLTLHKRPAVKERRPNTKRMIFVAGGYLRGSLDVVEAFNVDDKTWTTLPPLRVPRSGLGSAFLKGNFYAVGGRNNTPGASFDSDWVDRYNPLNETWRPCSPMTVPRHRSGVAVMDELLYAVGGSAGSEYHSSVEYFDPEEDRWTLVKPMHSKRFGVGVAVVNRLLYAIGGFDGNDRLASMECYHPENNAWTVLPSMKLGRSGAGVAALNQHIYVVGGFDGQHHLSTVERFDTEQQTWEMVAEIKTPRSALSLTVLDGKLFAMGGFDGQLFLTIVEVYDPAKNEWEEGTPLTSGRSGHASAVIYQPACPSGSHQDMTPVGVPNKKPGMTDEPMVTDQHGGGRGSDRGPVNINGNGGQHFVPLNDQPEPVNRLGNVPNSRRESVESPRGPERVIAPSLSRPVLPMGVALRGKSLPQALPQTPNHNANDLPGMVNGERRVEQPDAVPSTSSTQGNPFKNNLLDMNLLKSMCENMSSSSGICSYFNSGNSSHQAVAKPHNQPKSSAGLVGMDLSQTGANRTVQEAMTVSSTTTSPPIRIAKKREAESPNIPCTPPNELEIKMRMGTSTYENNPGPAFNSGVKTFLPVVDFQNQRKYRRKINPTPIRHPSYNTINGNKNNNDADQPMDRDSSDDGRSNVNGALPPVVDLVPPPPPPAHVGCATMQKIKEVVKQKLFSPSMLLSSSSSSGRSSHGIGSSSSGSSSSYQDKLKMNRSDLISNRRSVLCNVNDDSSESDNPMDDGR